MARQRFLNTLFSFLMITSLMLSAVSSAQAKSPLAPNGSSPAAAKLVSGQAGSPEVQPAPTAVPPTPKKRLTPAERQAAADRNTAAGLLPGVASKGLPSNQMNAANLPQTSPIDETVVPHYFGPFANYANSPLPTGIIASITVNSPGSGYSAATDVSIVDAYGTGKDATAQAVLGPNGSIDSITVVNTGSGYSAPMVVITDVNGSGAVATPNLGGLTGGIHKFVDSIAGLDFAGKNNLGQYIPIAIPDQTTFPGSDYYEIELGQYTEQLHSDLPPTTLRGYRQTNTSDPNVSKFHSLGPLIITTRNVPVRIKFTNKLGTGTDGNLFLPVDETVMGAGMGPKDASGAPCDPMMSTNCAKYSQNRATLHLHGGLTPWISDGTPHQWITPAGENTQYPKGVSVTNVPDMWFTPGGQVIAGTTAGQTTPPAVSGATNDPGDGSETFYYTNQQSARLQFYHDHAYGITRLNVYAGEAAGYLITDDIEKDLINGTNVSGVNPGLVKALPDIGFPLILQDKTFVDATTIAAQDPTWKWGTGVKVNGRPAAKTGDLWLPHVYMPIQNPWDAIGGANAFGRWQYGPWFWPPTENITKPAVANEYFDPLCNALLTWCEPPMRPDSPTPSMGMESYMDTPQVNGTIYPYMDVAPKPYRFRILNAADDRFFNLQFYVAADKNSPTTAGSTGTVLCNGSVPATDCTEVKMVNALATNGYPEKWPTDGRAGGAPDPNTAGPAWIQIGSEGGFLPAPTVIQNQPVNWNMNPGNFNFSNVSDHSLLLGVAERADVIVDFSAYAGKTIILYNDAPTAFPALDPRYDYYTGDPSQMTEGGAPTTQPGFGPNTHTVMQFRVSGQASQSDSPTNYYDPAVLSTLNSVFASTAAKKGVFEKGQDPIIVPQSAYSSAYYGKSFPNDASQYVKITDRSMTFTPMGSTKPVTITFQEKAMHDEMGASYDQEYGRMSGSLGLELPGTNNLNQNIILYGYASPPVDVLKDSGISQIGTLGDGTQLWKITHNGVDTHPIHFHLVNVQLINRVGWDGVLLRPDANELGWKETVRVNPLESIIVAMRPVAPTLPFELPNSVRLIDPTQPEGVTLMGPPGGFLDPLVTAVTVTNHLVNYGWEYVWHCHILSHEEMDMMHSLAFAVPPRAPTNLVITGTNPPVLTWQDNSIAETGYTVQRATDPAFTSGLTEFKLAANSITYTDNALPNPLTPEAYYYRVFADNEVGDTSPGLENFPVQVASSDPSNVDTGNSTGTTSKISGNAAGINGVTITYTGDTSGTALSSVSGSYLLTIPTAPNWTGTVTPSKAGYTFSPASLTFTAITTDQTGQNFSLFSKIAPLTGSLGTAINPTISWTAKLGATTYEYCVDDSNNNTCNTSWVNVGNSLSAGLSGLINSTTYYWQVRPANATTAEADGGTWWSFATAPGAFTKIGPSNGGAAIVGTGTTLSWTASANAKDYQYCYDLTNNTTCENPWVSSGVNAGIPNTSVDLTGLTRGRTYYWQVRAVYSGSATYADNTSTQFWSFTLANPGGINITQSAPAAQAYGSTFTVSATSINGTLAYSSLTPAVCSTNNSTSGVFTMLNSTGVCTVKYDVPSANTGSMIENVNAQKATATVTAAAKHKTFGDSDPTLTYTGNLVLSDTLTLKRVSGENAGDYKISINTFAASSKYNLTYVEASLTIDKLPVTINPDAQTKTYGSDDPLLTYTFTPALVGTDHFTGALSHAGDNSLGDHLLILGTLTAGGNYDLTISPANLTITKRPITVTVDDKVKAIHTIDPQLTYKVTAGSLVGSDSFIGKLTRARGEALGGYLISQGSLTLNSNYTLTFVSAKLLIVPSLTLTISGNVGVGGAIINHTGGAPVKASVTGAYSFKVPYNWSGTVTPIKTDYTFSPPSRVYTQLRANKPANNFTTLVSISGNVGVAGVILTYKDVVTKKVTSDSAGNYIIWVPFHWSGRITPSKVGISAFTPVFRQYSNIVVKKISQNYTPK